MEYDACALKRKAFASIAFVQIQGLPRALGVGVLTGTFVFSPPAMLLVQVLIPGARLMCEKQAATCHLL